MRIQTRGLRAAGVLTLVLLSAGCGDPSGPAVPAARIDAQVTGAIETTLTGAATWHVGTPPTGGPRFQMATEGGGEFGLWWDRTGKPDVGVYQASIAGGERISFVHIRAQRFFVADTGEIRITRWITDRVAEGSFDIEAFQWCPTPVRATACDQPWNTIPDAPRVRITGTFVMHHDGS